MKKRLQEQFRSRIPIVIRRRNNMFYYQLQIDIAGNDITAEALGRMILEAYLEMYF